MSFAPTFPVRPDPLRFWRRVAPDRTALVDRTRGGRWSYAELDAAADRWSGLLRARGVGRGDRVATLAGNRVEQVELFFACGRVGCALVPLNWRLPAAELAPVLASARAALLFGEGRFRATAEQANGDAWVDLDEDAPAMLERGGPAAPDAAIDPEDPWLVLFTSGSTGTPKGAMLPHRQILYNAVATTTAWELGPQDVAPVSTPLFHTGGWNVFATPLWHRGGTVVLFDGFDPESFLEGMAGEGCTMALTVPTQLTMLMESEKWGVELPALRHFMSGGAPCPSPLMDRVRAAGYAIRQGYGLTECGPNCFASSEAGALQDPESVGSPVPFLEMRLVDDGGEEVEEGAPGELLLRGPQVFAGYLGRPEQTAEAFAPGGWLRTGDLARRGPEGRFTICGRRKEMFISGGENVFPGEVEAALSDCPAIAEAVILGVPDARWGEVGRAFVVRRSGEATEHDVLAHARQRLAGYKVPKSVVFLDEIPRLGSGKPDRHALARFAGAAPSRGRSEPTER